MHKFTKAALFLVLLLTITTETVFADLPQTANILFACNRANCKSIGQKRFLCHQTYK